MLKLVKNSDVFYTVVFENNVKFGELLRDVDGFFYFWIERANGGCISDFILKELAEKMEELNKDWKRELEEHFKKVGPCKNDENYF